MPIMRHGVRLPPMKARIFDLIQARPGISGEDLCRLLYESVTPSSLVTTRVHVKQIREMLRGTGVAVLGHSYYGYHVTKEKSHAAKAD